jgi:hypothetical protein
LKKLISSFAGGFIIAFCPFKMEDFYMRNNIFIKIMIVLAVICAIYFGCSLIFVKDKLSFKNTVAAVAGMILAALLL